MWETTVMHKQVSGWTVNFCPNSPVYPFLELKTRIPPPFWKTSDLGWPMFTPEYPPISENFRFRMTKVYSGIPPPTSDLGWPKFTPEYPPILENFRFGMTKVYSGIPPPISENFRFGMTKVYSGIPPPFQKTSDLGWPKFTPEYPPHFGKLQIWDDQSFLWNNPPNENCQRVQVWDFQNTESYYMWRLYPTRITTSCWLWLPKLSTKL